MFISDLILDVKAQKLLSCKIIYILSIIAINIGTTACVLGSNRIMNKFPNPVKYSLTAAVQGGDKSGGHLERRCSEMSLCAGDSESTWRLCWSFWNPPQKRRM